MNVEWLAQLPAPVRRQIYFGLQGAVGSRIRPIWREFQTWDAFSPSQLEAAVEQKLGRVLDHAVGQVEYYRGLRLARRPGERAVDFLRRFPPLRRPAVREHFATLVTDRLRAEITSPTSVCKERYGWLVVKTGGTTGVPTAVVHDADTRDWGRATRLYAARACGFPLGTPYFRLWGSEPDLMNVEASLHLRVQRHLLGEILLNAFKSKEAQLHQHHASIMARPNIRHMMAYVDAAASFAMFIQDKNLARPRFDSVQACAGTVTPELRQIIQETFGCQVFNKYGSRECTDMACECAHHTGLHVFSRNCFLEVVDDQFEPCRPGQLGRLLVTILTNFTFPMIRYEIGDVAAWAETTEPCPCGLPYPRLRSIEGRQDDLLVTEDGTLQSSAFVRHYVGVSLNRHLIREWQLEQADRHRFVFRYIPLRREGLAVNLAELEAAFRRVLGAKTTLECKEVAEIPPSRTGKVRWVINTYREGLK